MTEVVLVEDDILLARQFVRELERSGCSVRHAKHAGEAILAIDERLPQVIILDVLLPATSGLALLHELQSYSDTAKIPVVLCSTMADELSSEDLDPYGVRRVVDKVTMQAGELAAAVRAVV